MGELFFSGGTFYGTAQNGGASGNGDVFSFNPKTGALTTLYTFSGGADGATPVGSLTELKGVLYGTAETGGANGYGTVYGINPATGAETTLYSFTNGADGAHPWLA